MVLTSPEFKGLPAPAADRLVIYVLGPGFGESQVIVFPDRRVVVIDCCVGVNGDCLPRALLNALSCKTIDLLVLTHPHLDHVQGLSHLTGSFTIRQAWRYPHNSMLRDLLSKWSGKTHGKMRDLRAALDALRKLQGENLVFSVAFDDKVWPAGDSPYALEILAPTPHDILAVESQLDRLVGTDSGKPELWTKVEDYLSGGTSSWSDRPNAVSLAIALRWKTHRVLLAGDVENGDGTQFSGWRGVLDLLTAHGKTDRIRDLSAIKVAHHGSDSAFHPPAWAIHAEAGKVPVAIVTPFSRGTNPPPHSDTAKELRARADHLVVTADGGGAMSRVTSAGWTRHQVRETPATTACAAVVLQHGEKPQVHVSQVSRQFLAKP